MGEKPTYRKWASKMLGFGKPEEALAEPAAEPAGQSEPEAEHKATFTENLVLVIDDSEIDRLMLEDLLDGAGYDVMLAEDGEAGLELFFEHLPMLTVTDMYMPGKKGDRPPSCSNGSATRCRCAAPWRWP